MTRRGGAGAGRFRCPRSGPAAPASGLAALLLPLTIAGCVVGERNGLFKARQARAEAVTDRQQESERREEVRVRMQVQDREAELVGLRAALDKAGAERASASAALADELAVVQALEQDLTAARVRRAAIEKQLAELVALEQRAAQQQDLEKKARAQIAESEAELARLRATAAKLQDEVTRERAAFELRARQLRAAAERAARLRGFLDPTVETGIGPPKSPPAKAEKAEPQAAAGTPPAAPKKRGKGK